MEKNKKAIVRSAPFWVRQKKIHYLSHNRALTTTMVGLNPKSTEVVLEEKVKEINSKESIGWSWVLLAVASIHF